MKTTQYECDKEVVELLRVMQKGLSKYGIRKVTEKLKEIDIENSYENYKDVRDYIVDNVCLLMKVDREHLINKTKRGTVTTARKIAVVVIKKHFDISDENLAQYFKGRRRQVIYKIMKEFEQLDRENKVDQKNFFRYFDIVDNLTKEYISNMNQ